MNNTDELRALSEKYDMQPDHFHKDPRGFVIMTRRGVEHLQAKIKAEVPDCHGRKKGLITCNIETRRLLHRRRFF